MHGTDAAAAGVGRRVLCKRRRRIRDDVSLDPPTEMRRPTDVNTRKHQRRQPCTARPQSRCQRRVRADGGRRPSRARSAEEFYRTEIIRSAGEPRLGACVRREGRAADPARPAGHDRRDTGGSGRVDGGLPIRARIVVRVARWAERGTHQET